ncbi:MAG TPA: hypothetical protein VKW77_10695 [Acidimicrobiales bacterium]|nr:hypothetical protein [Acidimicrobiales bacterium]
MIVVDILGVALTVSLFGFAMLALWIGLLAVLGAVRLVRCERCEHLALVSVRQPLHECARCRHRNLLHPLAALHRHQT